MKYIHFVLSLFFIACVISAQAGNSASIDARQFLVPVISASKETPVNTLAFENIFMLQIDAANDVFHKAPAQLTISNFAIPLHGESTLKLRKTADVFDANTQFLINTANGKRRFKVRPIYSYLGEVEGDAGSRVTLHYSDGDLTGFIQHSDGSRTNIGRDIKAREIEGASQHFVSNENAISAGNTFKDFVCGNDLLPVDDEAMKKSMAITASKISKGESIQQMPLLEMNLAIVLREDIDSILKRVGYTDEQEAQQFAKLIAAVSQAYEEDLRTRLYIGYLLVHTLDEPSGYVNTGSNPPALLSEFSRDWSISYSGVDRTIAHIYTVSRPSGNGQFIGGVGYGGDGSNEKLCSKEYRGGYSISTINLTQASAMPGSPYVRNAFVWDMFVSAHEMGHNVGAPHSHNCYWSPPLDTCLLISDGTDACYNDPSLRRVRTGTIMSYCHLVNGSSTAFTFGPRISEAMRSWIEDAPCVIEPPAPKLSITSPRGSEKWTGGQAVTIKWVSSKVSLINLEYSPDGGSQWIQIIGNKPAADSEYVWSVPSISANELWIRISDASNPAVNAVSIASHSISIPLTFVSPAGGERIGQKTNYTIRWAKTISENVNLDFAPDGTTFTSLAANISGSSYDWTTPEIVTESARLRLTSVQNSEVTTQSNTFAIGVPWFRLLIPGEGAVICSDVATQYKWEGDFIDRIKIQYSIDDGTTWKNALTQVSVPLNQFQIFSKGSSLNSVARGTKAILRVVESAPDTVLDTRSNLTVDTCGVVTSVDGLAEVSNMQITRVVPNPASTNIEISVAHANSGEADVVLVDVAGRERVLSTVSLTGNPTSIISVALNSIAPGYYRLIVKSGASVADTPLTIVH
ncbi:MAG: T9SS type A sorting domain-containing protein [Ignavibacteria bacterium]|nr:T9SS type A sorting domain-containing protein [Ignavibacteria bacterium]